MGFRTLLATARHSKKKEHDEYPEKLERSKTVKAKK